MEEIKFRAWLKKEKKMTNTFSLPEILYEGDGFNTPTLTQMVLMQYTGLKDSKRTKEYPEGQEIYEGDIVRSITGKAASAVGEEGVIKWYSCPPGFGVKWEYISNCRIEREWLEDMEVIGNIYEDRNY